MMSSRIKHYFKRCKEEGFKNSLYLFYKKIERVIFKRYVRLKILNADKLISDEKFFWLIDLKTTELKNVRSLLENENYDGAKSEFIDYLKVRKTPKFFFDPKEKGEIVKILLKNFPEEVKETIRIADLICQHSFKWLTPNCPDFGDKIRWHSNFLDDREWPLNFYMDLDYSSERRLGDVRQVWELNRHQFFVTLGKAYWITGDDKYATEFLNQLTDWINKNPYGYGINWLHSQEAVIRAVSLIWAFYLFSDFPGFDVDKKILMLKSLYQHGDYILFNLSDGSVTHNHLISEVCGLAVIGIMLPEFKKAKKWRNIGIRIFEREVIKQIWEDGVSGELSTNYHLFVLDSFIQLSILMKKNGYKVLENIDKRIEKMVEYVMYLCKPDGTIANLGDSDSGRAFRLSEYEIDDKLSYLSTGTVLYQRGDFKKIAKRFYEESFWLLGDDELKNFRKIEEKYPKETSKLFKSSGIGILRDSWDNKSDYLVFRGGPTELRKGVSIGHNHADSLSFEFFTNGSTVVIDSGTYLYSLDNKWRFYFRKTLSHNTIVIDERDQADVASQRFGLSAFPLSNIHRFTSSDTYNYIDMSHTGYKNIGVSHRRKLLMVKKRYLIILDEITGSGIHQIEQYFHLNYMGLIIDKDNRTIDLTDNKNEHLMRIVPIYPNILKLDIFQSEINPILGWTSSKYGEKHPSPVVRYSLKDELPIILGTLLYSRNLNRILVEEFSYKNMKWKIKINSTGSADEFLLDDKGNIAFSRQQINSKNFLERK